MGNEILIAGLAFVGTCIGTLGGILTANRLSNYRIQQLEERVNKHNALIDRTYKLEENGKVTDEKIKVINHRIEDLEEIR